MVFLIQIKEKKMKKNFLKIAALLIAAMLLVVSCSQEIAPKNDNLVNASVNIADTRSLTTTGEELGTVTYEYKLTKNFTQVQGNSTIVGEKSSWTAFPSDNKLGYVTQGLWTIEVQGKVGNNVVLYGKADHYFNNQNEVAKVFVNPSAGEGKGVGEGTVSINSIKMQDLDKETGTKYTVKYALTPIDAEAEATSVALDRAQGSDNTSTYSTASAVTVSAGYYRLTISVWGPNPKGGADVLIGGVTKSIRVLNGSNVVVSGSVEPKDFDKSEVNVVLIEPQGKITKDVESPVTGQDIVITVEDKTVVSDLTYAGYTKKENGKIEKNDGNVYAVSYIWDENGSKVTTTTNTHTLHYAVPGPKTVSCAIVYKVKSFGEEYTYVSAVDKSLILEFVVNEATTQSSPTQI